MIWKDVKGYEGLYKVSYGFNHGKRFQNLQMVRLYQMK